jgi:hypothetical protein
MQLLCHRLSAEPAVVSLAESYFSGAVRLQTAPQRALGSCRVRLGPGAVRAAAQSQCPHSQASVRLDGPLAACARVEARPVGSPGGGGRQPGRSAGLGVDRAGGAALQACNRAGYSDHDLSRCARWWWYATLQMERSLASLQRQSGVASNGDLESMFGTISGRSPRIIDTTSY